MSSAEILLAELEERGIVLSLGNHCLHYRAPTGVLTQELKETIRGHKIELMEALSRLTSPYGDLLHLWEMLGKPRVPTKTGEYIIDLKAWLISAPVQQPRLQRDIEMVRGYLLEYLSPEDSPAGDLLLDEWRRCSIPAWRNKLQEAITKGYAADETYARWMFIEMLEAELDPEVKESKEQGLG